MACRADNGDGSCCEIKSGIHAGKWRVQYTQCDEFYRKHRLSRVFKTKTEAKNFLHDLRHGTAIDAAKKKTELTLGAWFDWLAEHDWPESLAENTIAGRVSHFNNYVRDVFGGVPLKKIDPMHVRMFYRSLKAQGTGQATIHGIKRELVRVFNQAISPYGRVPMTYANPFRLDIEMAPRRDAVALTPDEAKKALRRKTLTPSERAMLGVFLLGGLRLGEQMALTRGQILFEQNLIYIDRSVKQGKTGRQTIGLPKGKKKRFVVMCPTLKALLWEVAKDMEAEQLMWSAAIANQPRMRKLVYAAWGVIKKKAKLPGEMTIHDCRLTHINWVEKLMPEVSSTTLKEHVGHATSGVTETNYTRPLTTAQTILSAEIERVAGMSEPKAKRLAAKARKLPLAREAC